MKNKTIVKAFDSINPTQTQKDRIRASIAAHLPEEKTVRKGYQERHTPPRRWNWIPAAAAMMVVVFLGVFTVVGYLENDQPTPLAQESQVSEFFDSQLYQAIVEWNAYLKACGVLDDGTVGGMIAPYSSYGCENEQMMKKLDDLCAAYGLKLEGNYVSIRDYRQLMDIVWVDTVYADGADITYESDGGGFYSDGSFTVMGTVTMNADDSPWIYPVNYGFHRIMKSSFHSVLLEIGDTSQYEHWKYTTQNGVEVLLALHLDKALILVEREDSVILVTTTDNRVGDVVYGEQAMDKAAMEAFADSFDFTLSPDGGLAPIPDPEAVAKDGLTVYSVPSTEANIVDQIPKGTELTLKKREWFYGQEWALIEGGWIPLKHVELTYHTREPSEDTDTPDPYDAILKKYVTAMDEKWDMARCTQEDISLMFTSFVQSPERVGYTLRDMDGDGERELLITDGEYIYDLYTMTDQGAVHLLSGVERIWYVLCEDNVIYSEGSAGAAASYHTFAKVKDGTLAVVEAVIYDASMDPENPWFYSSDGETREESLHQSAAAEIIDSYAVTKTEIPFQQFSVNQ